MGEEFCVAVGVESGEGMGNSGGMVWFLCVKKVLGGDFVVRMGDGTGWWNGIMRLRLCEIYNSWFERM